MQLDRIDTQDSVISSLQNVKRLRSPPRLSGPSRSESDRILTHRWDMTPPTTASTTERRQDLHRILADKPQTNGTPAGQSQSNDPYRRIQPTAGQEGNRMSNTNATPSHQSQHHSQRDSQMSEPPPLEPDENKTISRAAEVRELSSEARCGSCHLAGRRCYIDSAQPRFCVSCPTENHCIFRRTVVREGPATHFLWHELVGIHNIPQAMPLHHQHHMMQQQQGQAQPQPQPHPHSQHQPQPQPLPLPQPQPQSQGQLPQLPPPQVQPPRPMEMAPAHATPQHSQHQPGPQPTQATPQNMTPAQQQLQGPQTSGPGQAPSQPTQQAPASATQSQQ